MSNEEYIKEYPERFRDGLDRWLFKELSIMGGCCSAQKSMEYSIAREVGEKLLKALFEEDDLKDWLNLELSNKEVANPLTKFEVGLLTFLQDASNEFNSEKEVEYFIKKHSPKLLELALKEKIK